MLADGLTKEDPFRGNGALEHFLRTGVLGFVDMEAELERHRSSTDAKSRPRLHLVVFNTRTSYISYVLFSLRPFSQLPLGGLLKQSLGSIL